MHASPRRPGGARLAALVLLVLPLAIYSFLYLMPIGSMVALSVDNGELGRSLVAFRDADPADADARAAALLADMQAMDAGTQGATARGLNQNLAGFRSLFLNTARKSGDIEPTMAGLVAFDPRWAEEQYWQVMERNTAPFTLRHFGQATGLALDDHGRLTAGGDDIYVQIMWRTLVIAVQVTFVTLLISYPLAYAVANARPRFAAFVLVAVLMSFWTSILVRTTAWVILLQTSGLVNAFLLWTGAIAEPLQLIFNRFGAIVSMTHVLLPLDRPLLPAVDAEARQIFRGWDTEGLIVDTGDQYHRAATAGLWAGGHDRMAMDDDWGLCGRDDTSLPVFSARTFLSETEMRPTLWLRWKDGPVCRMA